MRWNIGYFGAKDLFTLINLSGGLFGVYFAFQGDIQTLDPHGLFETFTLGFQANFYEGLVTRTPEVRPFVRWLLEIEFPKAMVLAADERLQAQEPR